MKTAIGICVLLTFSAIARGDRYRADIRIPGGVVISQPFGSGDNVALDGYWDFEIYAETAFGKLQTQTFQGFSATVDGVVHGTAEVQPFLTLSQSLLTQVSVDYDLEFLGQSESGTYTFVDTNQHPTLLSVDFGAHTASVDATKSLWYSRNMLGPSLFIETDKFSSGLRRVPDGDATRDGKVDFADFLVLVNNWGSNSANYFLGDFTYDRAVGFRDFVILSENFGATAESSNAVSVPELSCALHATLITLLLVLWRRRCHKTLSRRPA